MAKLDPGHSDCVLELHALPAPALTRQKIVAPWAQAPGTMRLRRRPREESQGHPELRWVAAGCRLPRMESSSPSPGMPCGF